MENSLTLTLACDDYELVRPLSEGRVTPEGLHLVLQQGLSIAERQLRMVHEIAFDVCELSVTTYALARERELPLSALPIFLLRRFRHGDIFINTSAGIGSPRDLIGKKIGGISYQVASNVWARGILAEHYRVPHDSITWVVEREEEINFAVPHGLRIERLDSGVTLETALLQGHIDALMSPVVPASILTGDSRIARMFPNFKDIEAAYLQKSGIFPIMHVLAIKRALIEQYPWIPTSLYNAFDTAKDLAYKRMAAIRAVPLAWFGSAWEEERRMLGPDPWAYGLRGANKTNLETVLRYMCEQGLLRDSMKVEGLFVDA